MLEEELQRGKEQKKKRSRGNKKNIFKKKDIKVDLSILSPEGEFFISINLNRQDCKVLLKE